LITVGGLHPDDRQAWENLFVAYNAFYERTLPSELYDRAWRAFQEDVTMHALAARLDGRLVGIAHFLVHVSTSAPDSCYLQDLFTAPDARGKGVATTLIRTVEGWARHRGCARLYWQTHQSNYVARRLYDQIANNRGFIVYQISI
jgi:GNAT superfamily N-acetyltransferase